VRKSERMKRAKNVILIENIRNSYKILAGNHDNKNHLRDLDVDGRTILVCILKKRGMRVRTE
jgi:hypothetical protein